MKKCSGIETLLGEIVKAVLHYSEPERIILFGSRASDFWVERSDIDIAIMDGDATDKQKRRIREAIDEIRTLHRIDIVWLDDLTEEFRAEILSTGKIIYEGEEKAILVEGL